MRLRELSCTLLRFQPPGALADSTGGLILLNTMHTLPTGNDNNRDNTLRHR